MKQPSAFSGLLSVIIASFAGAMIMAGFGSIASDFFNWNLALSIGGSDIALPADRYAGIAFLILGAIVWTLQHFWDAIKAFLSRHKLSVGILSILLVLGIIFGGSQLISYLDGGPAISAAMNNDTETLKELFERGEVSAEDHDQMMMWAAQKGHLETIQLLLSKGVSANAQREDGLTALEAACYWGGEQAVNALKDGGASGECPN